MPRLRKYHEHINDHQLQLVQSLAGEGKIVPAYEPEDLPGAIAEARKRTSTPISSAPPPMLGFVEKAIEELLYERGVKGEKLRLALL